MAIKTSRLKGIAGVYVSQALLFILITVTKLSKKNHIVKSRYEYSPFH